MWEKGPGEMNARDTVGPSYAHFCCKGHIYNHSRSYIIPIELSRLEAGPGVVNVERERRDTHYICVRDG